MNNKLRDRIKAIVASIKSGEVPPEKTIRALQFDLRDIRVSNKEDQALIIGFYAVVRKYLQLRASLNEDQLPDPVPREDLSDDDNDAEINIRYKMIPDPFSAVASYSIKEKLKLFKTYCELLQTLLVAQSSVDVGNHDHYFVKANEIVSTHRYLMRLLGSLPWSNYADRDYFTKHLVAIYNRFEDYGWQCEAGKATGLLPIKKSLTEYDALDFEKKLTLFLNALKENNAAVPYPKPAASVKALLAQINELEIQANKIQRRQQETDMVDSISSAAKSGRPSKSVEESKVQDDSRQDVNAALSTTIGNFQTHQRSSARVAIRLSLASASATQKPTIKKTRSASQIAAEEKEVSGSLLQLFALGSVKRTHSDSDQQKTAKRVRPSVPETQNPVPVSQSIQGLFSHRRSMLRSHGITMPSLLGAQQELVLANTSKTARK
jgi:hypothetical protein